MTAATIFNNSPTKDVQSITLTRPYESYSSN
jgi:hypothetical protein